MSEVYDDAVAVYEVVGVTVSDFNVNFLVEAGERFDGSGGGGHGEPFGRWLLTGNGSSR